MFVIICYSAAYPSRIVLQDTRGKHICISYKTLEKIFEYHVIKLSLLENILDHHIKILFLENVFEYHLDLLLTGYIFDYHIKKLLLENIF